MTGTDDIRHLIEIGRKEGPVSALSDEFTHAKRLLAKAEAMAAVTHGREAGFMYALIGIGHAVLANAQPSTGAEARQQEQQGRE